ncbi:MAG: FAD-binding oxidoreductase [Candidatus Zixiibacteriota bacterium]
MVRTNQIPPGYQTFRRTIEVLGCKTRVNGYFPATMSRLTELLDELSRKFSNNRLTYQKGIPTLHPESVAEAAGMIRAARGCGQKLFITGFGNNIDPVGPAFAELVTLRDDRLNDLLAIDEASLTITVGAGFPLREINAKLREQNLFFPHSNLPYVGSVGGAIAVGLGARLDRKHWEDRVVAGEKVAPTIDISRYILGLDVATPLGQVRSFGTGSERVASGENFARVFSPSWGLYGFIAAAKLRVAPLGAQAEYDNLTQNPISQSSFLVALDNDPQAKIESVRAPSYAAQVRAKFDPDGVFPIVYASGGL